MLRTKEMKEVRSLHLSTMIEVAAMFGAKFGKKKKKFTRSSKR